MLRRTQYPFLTLVMLLSYGPNLRRGAAQSGPVQMLATASAKPDADR